MRSRKKYAISKGTGSAITAINGDEQSSESPVGQHSPNFDKLEVPIVFTRFLIRIVSLAL